MKQINQFGLILVLISFYFPIPPALANSQRNASVCCGLRVPVSGALWRCHSTISIIQHPGDTHTHSSSGSGFLHLTILHHAHFGSFTTHNLWSFRIKESCTMNAEEGNKRQLIKISPNLLAEIAMSRVLPILIPPGHKYLQLRAVCSLAWTSHHANRKDKVREC